MKHIFFVGFALLLGSSAIIYKNNRNFRWYETSLFYENNPDFLEKVNEYFKCHPNMIINESNTRRVKDLIVIEMGYKVK